MLEHLEKYLRGDVVGEIPDDLQSPRKTLAQVHLQEIALDQPRCELGEMRMQVFDALRVDLGAVGGDVAAPEQELRQHPHPAADLQHVAGDCAAPFLFRGRRRTGSGRIRREPGIGTCSYTPPGFRIGIGSSCRLRPGFCPGIGTSCRHRPGFRPSSGISSHPRPGFRIGIGTSSRHRPGFRPGLRSYAPRKRIANLARDIEVDQEMLSQRLFCPYFTHFRLSVIRNNSRPRTPRS